MNFYIENQTTTEPWQYVYIFALGLITLILFAGILFHFVINQSRNYREIPLPITLLGGAGLLMMFPQFGGIIFLFTLLWMDSLGAPIASQIIITVFAVMAWITSVGSFSRA
jgi:hypothetical protein